jgi:hypothetical protein
MFGTGGTEGVDFEGLKEAFYHPDVFNCIGLPNIWEDDADNKCGFFCP